MEAKSVEWPLQNPYSLEYKSLLMEKYSYVSLKIIFSKIFHITGNMDIGDDLLSCIEG